MHDEQDPPVTPGAQTDPSGDEAAAGAVAVSEFDVELPFDGSDAGSSVGALAPAGPADAVEAEAAAAEVPATGEAAVTDDEPAVAPAVEAPPAEAPAGGDAGISTDDPEEATRRKLALLAEAEAIVATPDVNEAGNAPDDRHLTERLRAVENVWRQVGSAGDREAELRARLQELRQAYAAARSRRAEARAVDRARAAETKRALLVQAFALAQQVDPSIALPAAPARRPAVRRRPTPAMLARKPAGEKAEAERPAPAAEETTPADAVDVSAAETTAAETPAAETPAAETTATTEALPEPAAATAPDGAAEQAGGAPTTDESALAHDGATGP